MKRLDWPTRDLETRVVVFNKALAYSDAVVFVGNCPPSMMAEEYLRREGKGLGVGEYEAIEMFNDGSVNRYAISVPSEPSVRVI